MANFKYILLVFIIIVHPYKTLGFKYGVLDGIINANESACNNQMCNDGPHSSCLTQKPIHRENCAKLQFVRVIELSNSDIKLLVYGHNGLRNRRAMMPKRPVANMNLLNWDFDLQEMAEGWIRQCTIDTDPCDFIYDRNISVGQNIHFEFNEHLPPRWIIRTIKHWFHDHPENRHNTGADADAANFTRSNYTQMMWPAVEFMGCAAAQFKSGYMLACNYHPIADGPLESVYKPGAPCSICRHCSYYYDGLCGLDMRLNRSRPVHSNGILVLIISGLASIRLGSRAK